MIKCNSLLLFYTYFVDLGVFYFTLGNLHPKYRSKLSQIHLVAMVTAPYLSKYGIDAVIKPFVKDVKKLVKKHNSY